MAVKRSAKIGVKYVIDSPLVIADLTDYNPNVFYELAIRHILKKPFIQMIKLGQKIPFDVCGWRTIPFDIDNLIQADKAKRDLAETIKSIGSDDFKVLSIDYLAVRNALKEQ